jgi:hypothetical protein
MITFFNYRKRHGLSIILGGGTFFSKDENCQSRNMGIIIFKFMDLLKSRKLLDQIIDEDSYAVCLQIPVRILTKRN